MSFQSGPVTEAQANASIIVDPELFVCRFTDVLYQATDAHTLYSVLSAYSVLAATTPPTLMLKGLGGKVLSNFWAVLIGPSGDRKSHIVGIAKDVLSTANSALIGSGEPGSEEAFIAAVAAQPTQLWAMLEMGKFLAAAKTGYLAKIKPTMTDLFDGRTQTRVLRKETISIVNPRFSVLGAITPHFLDVHSLPDDWEGGFLSRFAFGWAQRERTRHVDTLEDIEAMWLPYLVQRVIFLAAQKASPQIGIDDDALQFYREWCQDFEQRTAPYVLHLSGQRERTYLIAKKIALLNAWDTGLARSGEPWKMRLRELVPATRLAELCWQSSFGLAYLATSSKDVRDRRAVVSVLNTTEWVSTGVISRSVPEVGLKRRLGDVLETLVEERAILKMDGALTRYRLATAQEAATDTPDLAALRSPLDGGSTGRENGAPSEPAAPMGQILPFPGNG